MAKNDIVIIDHIIKERIDQSIPSKDKGEVYELLANEQILKDLDLSRDEILSGIIDGKDDGGIDSFYVFINGNLLSDDVRLTKFGRMLRSTSLDELPELINIINGDMSVIGPRPLPPTYNDFYKPEEMARFKVRGGLVTPDSVDPNPVISWDKQFQTRLPH